MTSRRTHRVTRPVGDRAVLVECTDLDDVLGVHAALVSRPLPGQLEVRPAARTVLVVAQDPPAARRLRTALEELAADPIEVHDGETVVLDTVYDGPDLDQVAQITGLGVEGVVRAHTEAVWTAAFGGFAPGFMYLVTRDDALHVPRLDTPRTAVPPGSVALGGPYSAVYPHRSPGGWQIIGRTATRLWDVTRLRPATIVPGMTVRFRAVPSLPVAPGVDPSTGAGTETDASPAAAVSSGLVVRHPGVLTLVEDLGRPGYGALGVTASGAADRGAALRANRLVGNPRTAAVLETVLGGLCLEARGDQILALTGAAGPLEVRDRSGVVVAPDHGSPFRLPDGAVLTVGQPAYGLRAYVGVRGGLAVEPVLGSRSTDVLSGLGPAPLRAGAVLPVVPPRDAAVVGLPEPEPSWLAAGGSDGSGGATTVRVILGPRADWLTATSRTRFLTQEWVVAEQSNRVGLRLTGDAMERSLSGELPSEGVVAGAVQVPSSGLPVVFLADHPVTGGYPVIAVVGEQDLDRLAQLRPGSRLRFLEG